MTNSWIFVCPLIICLILGIKDVSSMSSSHRLFRNEHDVDIKQFPWQAAIISSNADVFMCGGAIITTRHIITSTSCLFYNGDSDIMHASIGSSILGKGIEYAIKSNHTYSHKSLQYPFVHDIAIIELDGEIAFDETKRAIALPDKDETLPLGAIVTLTGWGVTLNGPISEQLRKQNLIITKNTICDAILQDFVGDDNLTPMDSRQVCGLPKTGTPECQGNMGTPVLYDNTLFGIAVEGTPCCEGCPEFINRVYDHVDWINQIISSAR